MHVINILLRPVAHVLDKSGKEVSLWHINGAVTVSFSDFVHKEAGHVLVVDVEDQIWTALVDLTGHFNSHHVFKSVISLADIVLVDEIQGVPLEIHSLVSSL